jgi:hypothetical protein
MFRSLTLQAFKGTTSCAIIRYLTIFEPMGCDRYCCTTATLQRTTPIGECCNCGNQSRKPLEITAVVSRDFAGSAIARKVLQGDTPWDYYAFQELSLEEPQGTSPGLACGVTIKQVPYREVVLTVGSPRGTHEWLDFL